MFGLKFFFFSLFFKQLRSGIWRFAAPQVCLEGRCVSQIWDAVGEEENDGRNGACFEEHPSGCTNIWLLQSRRFSSAEPSVCHLFFHFINTRLETSPWKAEGNLVDCKHGGEEELFRMVERGIRTQSTTLSRGKFRLDKLPSAEISLGCGKFFQRMREKLHSWSSLPLDWTKR